MDARNDARGTFLDKHTFRLNFVYPHPPSRVWKALTEPEQLAVWFMPLELELRVGGRALLLDYGQGDGVPAAEGPHLVRTLRRTERLVQRQLAALGAGGP